MLTGSLAGTSTTKRCGAINHQTLWKEYEANAGSSSYTQAGFLEKKLNG
jgi:hypothetical protein